MKRKVRLKKMIGKGKERDETESDSDEKIREIL